MLFDKDDKIANERTLYETRPSLLFGCKSAIFGIILLILLMMVTSAAIEYIGNMQVYLIKYVKVSFTRYFSIAVLVIIFILIIYIIIKLITWYSTEYILTDSRIIQKKGLLYTRKNYMHYNAIQDINSSQSILGRLFNVATISTYSAYDNNSMDLKNIRDAKKVEEIIFTQMNHARYGGFYNQPQYQDPYHPNPQRDFYQEPQRPYQEHISNYQSSQRFYDPYNNEVEHNHNPNYYGSHERFYHDEYDTPDMSYYDEYGDPEGVITPNHNIVEDDLDRHIDSVLKNLNYEVSNEYKEHVSNRPYHEEVRDYFIEMEDNKVDKESKVKKEKVKKDKKDDLSREKIIESHFDKFKL